MRLRGRTSAVAKGPGEQKGATIALFNWRLSKVIILSATARISLLRERLKGDRTETGRRMRRKGWIAGVRCVVSITRALSAPPLIAVFVAAPTTIPLPFSHKPDYYSSIPRTLQSTFCILAVYTHDYSEF